MGQRTRVWAAKTARTLTDPPYLIRHRNDDPRSHDAPTRDLRPQVEIPHGGLGPDLPRCPPLNKEQPSKSVRALLSTESPPCFSRTFLNAGSGTFILSSFVFFFCLFYVLGDGRRRFTRVITPLVDQPTDEAKGVPLQSHHNSRGPVIRCVRQKKTTRTGPRQQPPLTWTCCTATKTISASDVLAAIIIDAEESFCELKTTRLSQRER